MHTSTDFSAQIARQYRVCGLRTILLEIPGEGMQGLSIRKIYHRRIAFAGKQWYYYQKGMSDLHRQRHGQCIWRTMEAESQQT